MTHKLYFIADLVDEFKFSEKSIRKAISSGRLKACKPGREWRIREEDFDAYLEACSNTNKNRGKAS